MTIPATMRDLMVVAGDKARNTPAPERYRWIAMWWHLHARETMTPSECIRFARNQLRLYHDMLARPSHFRVKPSDRTDFEWSSFGVTKAQEPSHV